MFNPSGVFRSRQGVVLPVFNHQEKPMFLAFASAPLSAEQARAESIGFQALAYVGKRLPLQLQGRVDVRGVMGVTNDSRNRLYLTNPVRNLIARVTMSGDVGTVEAFAYSGPNPGGIVFNG